MNRIILSLIFVILLAGNVLAIDIAYVLDDIDDPESNLINAINELGYTYELIDEDEIDSVNFAGYSIILVGPGDRDGVPVNNYKSLIVNPTYYEDFSKNIGSVAASQPLRANKIDDEISITDGIDSQFKVYTQARLNGLSIPMYYLTGKKFDSHGVVSTTESKDEYVIATKENPRRVFFGITKTEYWTEDSKQLFKNSIEWLIGGGNNAPVFDNNNPIPEQKWYEDEGTCLDLSEYFSDPNRDYLTYGVYDTSENENVFVNIEGSEACFNSFLGWTGDDWIVFKATDPYGLYAKSNNVILKVIPKISDITPPFVELISPKDNAFFNDREVIFDFSAYDDVAQDLYCELYIDNSVMAVKYVESGKECEPSDCSLNENMIMWLPFDGDADDYSGKGNDGVINGGAGFVSGKTGQAISLDGYNDYIEAPDNVDWTINDNPKTFSLWVKMDSLNSVSTFISQYGNSLGKNNPYQWYWYFNFNDKTGLSFGGNYGGSQLVSQGDLVGWDTVNWHHVAFVNDGETFYLYLDGKEVANAPLTSDYTNLEGDPTIGAQVNQEGGSSRYHMSGKIDDVRIYERAFSLGEIKDLYSGAGQCSDCEWDEEINSFYLDNLPNGVHTWNIKCSDGINYAFADEDRTFTISAPNNPVLNHIGDKTVNENEILIFTVFATDPDGDDINLYVETDLPEGAKFNYHGDGTGLFSWIPDYCQSGNYPIKFTAKDSTGLKDSETIEITVKSAGYLPQFNDADTCEVITPEIKIEIKEPDDGDEFGLSETIPIKIKIKNGADEDLEFDVEAYLYDLDEDKTIEKVRDSIDIDEDDYETIELEIEIPCNIEDNDYAIFVRVIDEDEDYCNQDYVEIDIEREDHMVVIDRIEIDPTTVSPGEDIEVRVKVRNIGDNDEEVYIKIENSELGISEKSEEFELEEYGEDDTETESFYIEIPEDAEKKDYELKATVFYEDGKYSGLKKFSVVKEKTSTGGGGGGFIQLDNDYLIANLISSADKKYEVIKEEIIWGDEKETRLLPNNSLPLINTILIIGIGLIFILIVILMKRE